MKKSAIAAVALLAMLCVVDSSPVSAQKLYWTRSGVFGPFDIKGLIPTYPQSREITIPISMWILDHPKGLVVIDTGNNVAVSDGNCKSHWVAGLCDFLKPSQKRGDSVDKVKVVITSHAHLDHIGNIAMFPKAIHVIQKKELYQAWWPEKFQRDGAFVIKDYEAARDFNYLELEGDYDLFGDGTVVVLSTPGHTLGNQSVKVKLPETGTVIISQDAIWMKENLEGYPAGLNYSVLDYTKSLNRLKQIRDLEGAQLFMPHDEGQYKEKGGKWYK